MSFPALTTALLISTAPVNAEGTAAAPAPVVQLAAIDQDAGAAAPSAAPSEPAQTVAPPGGTPTPPSTEAAPLVGPSLLIEPDSSTDASQLPPSVSEEEIVVTGRASSPDDPLAALNAQSFEVTQKVDDAIVAPVAFAYKDTVPKKVRAGVRNFLNNLGEPVVFLAFLLEFKPGKAAETLGRFVINSTLGGAGLIDIAKRDPFHLPYRSNGFANVLGYYGVKQGPYFYLPLIGSTTLRDFIGNRLDQIIMPMALGPPFSRPEFAIPAAALSELDDRIEFDDRLREIRETRDPYVAAREYYLRKRQAEIDALHGRGDGTVPVIVPTTPAPEAVEPPTPSVPQNPSAPQNP